MRIARWICWLLLLAGALVYRLDRADAQANDAVRQACTPDAMRLCGDFIPDVAKITACMHAKSAQLSEPCRVAMHSMGGGRERVARERGVRERGGHERRAEERHGRHREHEVRHYRRGHRERCDPYSHLCS